MYTPQYLTDNKGNKLSVVLPMKEYQKIIEELEDIRLYDEAKKRNEKSIPFEQYVNSEQKNKPALPMHRTGGIRQGTESQ